MSKICKIFTFFWLVSFNFSVTSLEKNFCYEEIDSVVNDALKTFNIPGAAVCIVLNDQVVLSKGYGTRSANEELPITEQTLFPIASCTKAFTALILEQLADEGLLNLDDPVKKHIPELCFFDEERTNLLTIRDLLAHRTGIARHDPIWFFYDIPRCSIIDLVQHLEATNKMRQDFQYNNFMYAIAGIVIERVTGQSWETAIYHRLFSPLEMDHSNTSLDQLQTSSNFSLPHAEINGIITTLPFRNTFPVNPGSGINSNILDLANWVKLQLSEGDVLNKKIIQKQTLIDSHTIHMPFSYQPQNEVIYQLGYGLGWFIGKYRGYDFIHHNGSIDGFFSEIAILPEKRIGIVILTNSSSDGQFAVTSIRNQVIDKCLKIEEINWIQKTQENQLKIKDSLHVAMQNYFEISQTISPQSLGIYTGCYFHPAYGYVEVKIEEGHLIATCGKMKTPLYFKSQDRFIGQLCELLIYGINPNVMFSFFRDSLGNVQKVAIPFEGFRFAKPIIFQKN